VAARRQPAHVRREGVCALSFLKVH
jgi:hypothetical protein